MARGSHGETILVVGLVAGGLYLLYEAIQGLKTAGAAAGAALQKAGGVAVDVARAGTAPVAAPIGYAAQGLYNLWNWASGADITPSGNVILPDGTKVAMSDVSGTTFNDTYNVATFSYNRTAYAIVPNPDPTGVSYDANGNYHAITWVDFIASQGG